MLYQISAPHFTASVVFHWNGWCMEAAPILGYMQRDMWHIKRVDKYCTQKRWRLEFVRALTEEELWPASSGSS